MAQHRIDNASLTPQFHIILWDDEGQFVERFAIGFCGDITSKIFYSLKPDVDGMDEAVVGMDGPGGLLDGSDEVAMRDGCTGSWNLNLDQGSKYRGGNKSKERWWHTERGRWRGLPLEKLF